MAEDDSDERIMEEEEAMIQSMNDNEPIIYDIEDRYNIAYIIFYIFGVTSVLPWNMFITANKYYNVKFQNVNNTNEHCTVPDNENKTYLQNSFENYFALAAMIPQVISLTITTILQHSVSVKTRMHVSIPGILALFVLTTILTVVNTDDWQEIFFITTLISVILVNVLSAIFCGTVFGLGGVFPPKYTQALMGGQGLGGVLPALLSILTTAVSNNHCVSAFIYFSCAVLSVVAAFVAFRILIKLKYADAFLNQIDLKSKRLELSDSWETKLTLKPPFVFIFKEILNPATLVTLVFLVTLTCFPGLTSSIQSIRDPSNSWTDVYFTAVTCFLLFNLMDWFGRSLTGFLQWPNENSPMLLSILVVVRFAFIPLFMLCNISSSSLPLVFNHDAYPIIFTIFFAASNGYLGSLCMMYGPRKVQKGYRETAGNMMALFLALGLALGSLLSFGMRMIILD
ncbi:equilibrative nucleoside transporter 1-like [Antedon mediterranea]|uniref:equilibrative nucleoside transporter 1-like n=1 Tax=Antedon mediterranea TaxID=105859 RepID=UPI003AF55A70